MENNLDSMWFGATTRKIQQIREEWEWLVSKIKEEKGDKDLNILEIGCYDGGSSWYLNHFAKNMLTIDNNDPCRFNPSDLGDGYRYIAGDSHHPEQCKHFSDYDWDFVFIDGDHSYEGVKADFYNILPFLKKGTMVAFHDIVISNFHHQHGCYVGEFWRDLKNEYKATKFEEHTTNIDWAGIGIVWT